MNNFERQKQRETDAVRDGALRWVRSTEYQLATDTKAVAEFAWRGIELAGGRYIREVLSSPYFFA